jgi:hypothetical protein
MRRDIFRKVALERLSSPDDLDQMVRITRPASWLALIAIVAIVAGGLVWATFGRVATTVRGNAILIETGADVMPEVIMYLPVPDASQVRPGMPARFSPLVTSSTGESAVQGEVDSVAAFPATQEDVLETLGSEALVAALDVGPAPVEVRIALDPDGAFDGSDEGALGTGTIITGEDRPLDFILPGRSWAP